MCMCRYILGAVETFLDAIPGAGIFRSELLLTQWWQKEGEKEKLAVAVVHFLYKLLLSFSSYWSLVWDYVWDPNMASENQFPVYV